jgi:opacity protein-like surface antigen
MKKVILAALASTVIASSASASFYAGIHGGVNIGKHILPSEHKDHVTDVKLHRQYDIKGGLEVGYNVMDNLGIGIEIGGYANPVLKTEKAESSTKPEWYSAVMNNATAVAAPTVATTVVPYPAGFAGIPTKAEHNFTVFSGMLKARLDLVDLDMAQIYVTGGVGGSRIEEDYKVSAEAVNGVTASTSGVTPVVAAVAAVPALAEVSIKTEAAYKLAFSAGAGVAFKLSDAMFLNVGVEYANMGETGKDFASKDKDIIKSKSLSKDNTTEAFKGETKFDALNVVAGIRFNF